MANGWMIFRIMSASRPPQRLAVADPQALKALGTPLKRAEALIHLANSALEGTLPMTIPGDVEQAMKTLQTFPVSDAGRQIILLCVAGRRKMFFCRMII